MERRRIVWAFGGGKGGVGKSLVCSAVATELARSGRRVVLLDADLGAANLHTLLGVVHPSATLDDFWSGRVANLEDVLVPTPIEGLTLISGAATILRAASPRRREKRRLLEAFFDLPADAYLIDLGAGTQDNTLDFFNIASEGVIVTGTEPTSIQNAYGFIKATLFRALERLFLRQPEARRLVERATLAKGPDRIESVERLLSELDARDRQWAELAARRLGRMKLRLVVNQATARDAKRVLGAIGVVCNRYLGLHLDLLGTVPSDPAVVRAVHRMVPVQLEAPDGAFASAIRMVCLALIEEAQTIDVDDALEALDADVYEPAAPMADFGESSTAVPSVEDSTAVPSVEDTAAVPALAFGADEVPAAESVGHSAPSSMLEALQSAGLAAPSSQQPVEPGREPVQEAPALSDLPEVEDAPGAAPMSAPSGMELPAQVADVSEEEAEAEASIGLESVDEISGSWADVDWADVRAGAERADVAAESAANEAALPDAAVEPRAELDSGIDWSAVGAGSDDAARAPKAELDSGTDWSAVSAGSDVDAVEPEAVHAEVSLDSGNGSAASVREPDDAADAVPVGGAHSAVDAALWEEAAEPPVLAAAESPETEGAPVDEATDRAVDFEWGPAAPAAEGEPPSEVVSSPAIEPESAEEAVASEANFDWVGVPAAVETESAEQAIDPQPDFDWGDEQALISAALGYGSTVRGPESELSTGDEQALVAAALGHAHAAPAPGQAWEDEAADIDADSAAGSQGFWGDDALAAASRQEGAESDGAVAACGGEPVAVEPSVGAPERADPDSVGERDGDGDFDGDGPNAPLEVAEEDIEEDIEDAAIDDEAIDDYDVWGARFETLLAPALPPPAPLAEGPDSGFDIPNSLSHLVEPNEPGGPSDDDPYFAPGLASEARELPPDSEVDTALHTMLSRPPPAKLADSVPYRLPDGADFNLGGLEFDFASIDLPSLEEPADGLAPSTAVRVEDRTDRQRPRVVGDASASQSSVATVDWPEVVVEAPDDWESLPDAGGARVVTTIELPEFGASHLTGAQSLIPPPGLRPSTIPPFEIDESMRPDELIDGSEWSGWAVLADELRSVSATGEMATAAPPSIPTPASAELTPDKEAGEALAQTLRRQAPAALDRPARDAPPPPIQARLSLSNRTPSVVPGLSTGLLAALGREPTGVGAVVDSTAENDDWGDAANPWDEVEVSSDPDEPRTLVPGEPDGRPRIAGHGPSIDEVVTSPDGQLQVQTLDLWPARHSIRRTVVHDGQTVYCDEVAYGDAAALVSAEVVALRVDDLHGELVLRVRRFGLASLRTTPRGVAI